MKENKLIILHDFNGRPYYKALEKIYDIEYLNTRPIRFIIRDLIKYRTIQKSSIDSLIFLFKLRFVKEKHILLAMAPYNWRIILYRYLSKHNKVTYHTSWPDWNKNTPFKYNGLLMNYLVPVWRKSLISFDERVAVTLAAKKSLDEFISIEDVSVKQIYHVVDSASYDMCRIKKKWSSLKDKTVNVAFVGRLEASKGIDKFLSLTNYEFQNETRHHIVGDGSYAEHIAQLACARDNIYYHGFVNDREQLHNLYENFHFLILPSVRSQTWQELFGVVIIEAMSKGVIVISTDHIGPKEIITNKIDGFILSEVDFVKNTEDIISSVLDGDFDFIPENAKCRSQEFEMSLIIEKWNSL